LSSKKEQLSKQFAAAKNALTEVSSNWDGRELIAYGKLSGSTQGVKSRISTGDLSSMLWERAARVAAQTPTGKIKPVLESDEDNAQKLQLTIENYVIPNSKHPFIIDNRLWVFNSYIYAQMPRLAYWRVEDDYVGPDSMLLNPRNVFIQAGKTSVYDAEYVFVSTMVSRQWLEDKKNQPGWKKTAINRILEQTKEGAARPAAKDDANRQTALDPSRNSNEQGDTQEFEVITKYAAGKKAYWCTFLPDYDNEIIREIPNRLPSGRIPIAWKQTMPLITSAYGVSDVERGESIQKTIDSFVNLAHEGAKYNVFPIHKYKKGSVQRASLKWQPGAFWSMSNPNEDVQIHQVGQNNLQSFTSVYQFLKSAQLNLFGSSDTMISSDAGNPSFGKTPEALKQQSDREYTRDRWDRDMYEQAHGDLIELYIEMILANNEVPLEFYVEDDDIGKANRIGVAQDARDANGMVKKRGRAKVVIDPKELEGQYRFTVDPGTSVMKEDSEEHERLTSVLSFALQIGPDALDQLLAQSNKRFDFGELFESWLKTSGISNPQEIIDDLNAQQSGVPTMQAPMPEEAYSIQDPETLQHVHQQLTPVHHHQTL
jgi:hypothetical protein